MDRKLAAIGKQAMVGILASLILSLGGIGAVLLIQICAVWGASRRGGFLGLRGASGAPSRGGECGGLKAEALRELPCYGFRADEDDADEQCAVCLEEFEAGDVCKLLPGCRHSFHEKCADAWLLQSRNCPVCRTPADRRSDGGLSGDRCRRGALLDMGDLQSVLGYQI